jgi:hypothetical protein
MDLYNYNTNDASGANLLDEISATDILKAMEAGLQTGMQYNNQINNGGGLKVESLDSTLKILGNRLNQLVYLMEMPKHKIDNTVHQYNQLYKYGEEVGIFNTEGETPEETDSQYRRKSIITKFMGVTGQVTHPAMLARLAGGMNMYTKEVENKTILLQTILDARLVDADSTCVPEQFDGVFRQHMLGVNEMDGGTAEGKTSEQLLDNYFNSPAVIDAQNQVLNDNLIQDAANVVVNVYNGYIDRIISNPIVFNNYVKLFHESKRVIVGLAASVTGATMGQSVNDVTTQFGKINIKNDRFFDERKPITVGKQATSPKAPVIPVAGTAIKVNNNDTKTNFGRHAGTYGYLVTAKNRYGESAPLNITSGGAQAVAATDSVEFGFTAGVGGAYAATCFVIYRTKKDAALNNTTEYYPIFEVPASQMASGWDGAAANCVRDRNRIIAGTKSALIYYNDNQINEYLQFADTMKMDFAITAPSRRFAILNYGTPVLYQPAKIVRIVNIGEEGLV